jgi:hypothetical protein
LSQSGSSKLVKFYFNQRVTTASGSPARRHPHSSAAMKAAPAIAHDGVDVTIFTAILEIARPVS